MIEKILESIGFSSDEIKIYFDLLEAGATTAGELSKRTGMVRPTVYSHLQKMVEKGAVVRSLKYGVRTFAAQMPEKLDIIFQQHIEELKERRKEFKELIPQLKKKMSAHYTAPKFQLYEGAEGVKHVFQEILLCRNIETLSFWPVRHMINTLTPEFLSYHNKERIRNNVSIRAVWPRDQAVKVKDFQFMGVGEEFKRYIRISPPEIDSTMGYWIYGNKVAFLSSTKELFGYVIESAETVKMLTTQWEYIWQRSEPLKVDKDDMKKFIRELENEGIL